MPKWLSARASFGVLLACIDSISLYSSIGIVHYYRLGFWIPNFDWQLAAIVGVTLLTLYVMNVYYLDRMGNPLRTAIRTFTAVAVSGATIASVVYVTKSTDVSTVLWRGNLPLGLVVFGVWASVLRYLAQIALNRFTRDPNWIVIGNSERGRALIDDQSRSAMGGKLLPLTTSEHDLDYIHIETTAESLKISAQQGTMFEGKAAGIILATDEVLPKNLVSQLMHARLGGITILEVADYYEQFLLRLPVMQLKDGWFAMSQGFALLQHDVQLKIKRILDILAASFGLILFAPVFLIVAVLVRTTSQGPAFYSQVRSGRLDREFRLHKFRTMVTNAEENGPQWAQNNDPRITPIGRLLRKTRIDELPQLWNVLVGQMSFIGPRPERPDFNRELKKQIPYYDLRHLVNPGITGWAQVMYPYGASVQDSRKKLEYDLYYIKNYSLAFDLYIALRTVRVVFSWAGR
ncbi:MAG: exopolysaccharide biosynthesis protein [marine bacterium B5-7]|nr:MAG: exopolysaccharide biosynthesis protein [marine bacterium B5-7]